MKPSAVCLVLLAWTCPPAWSARWADGAEEGTSRALIVVGLPGDAEHDAFFQATALRWKGWLTGPLGFPSAEVRLLLGASPGPGSGDAPATRESIGREVDSLRKKAGPGDRIWVFVLGHANLDDGRSFLHLPGPDLRDDQFAALFRGLPGREQVFWMTTAGSGSFLASLSAPGRIVMAATERDGETNETEFPHALAEVSRRLVAQLDLDKDGKVSVKEVFAATVEAVEARFARDKRAPTEHAQLDDNGDGVGTELRPVSKPNESDGLLASKTFLSMDRINITKPPARSEHGTDRVVPPAR
jgi:hypothetical protein